jgi:hypothetical protein
MHCINCDNDAVWLFKANGVNDTPYCNPHLPYAYRGSKNVTPLTPHVYDSEQGTFVKDPEPEVKPKRASKKVAATVEETPEA